MANGKIEKQWHAYEIDDFFTEIGSTRTGLSEEEAQRRLEQFGKNELRKEEGISPFQVILQQLMSPLIYVLFIAAIISFASGHKLDAFVILGIVVVNTVIGFMQEFRAEKAMEALKQITAPTAVVIRNGERKVIPAVDVVPGDLIALAAGDKVPADARIISSSNLRTDEASLTGESVPVDKSSGLVPADTAIADRTNIVFSGTVVTQGRGEAVVIETGESTQLGKIAESVGSVVREVTPLQKNLAGVGKTLAVFALSLAALVLVAGLLRGIEFVEIFLFAIASAVSAIPEGLPAVVTIVLAIGLQRMAARHAIIRKLPAVETLGSATVICSDKTGTLTKNEMTVERFYTCGREYKVTGTGYLPKGDILLDGRPIDVSEISELKLAMQAGVLCNDADLKCEDSVCSILGDPTEGALIVAGAKTGFQKAEISEQMPRIAEVPFDSEKAYMATLNDAPDRRYIFVKGAPEKIVAMCSSVMCDGEAIDLTEERKNNILEANLHFASRALRVIGLAYKDAPKEKSDLTPKDTDSGLVFLGLAGMIDPPRPEAIQAIERCKRAGIKVMMATGDHKITAKAIAEQMGIIRAGNGVVEGKELDKMTDQELTERIETIDVFARVEPAHKMRIVEALKRRGHIVAMTGDGVNDAPALKRADIGIAMGITGTDVSKEASEMVLTDDNFASIVGAVEEGRIIFNNIKKVVTYLISTNSGEMLTILTTVLFGLPLPLVPVQILWVNLVTDSFPGLALAADPPDEDVLAEPPRPAHEKIITRGVIIRLVLVATIMAAGTASLFYWGLVADGIVKARTLAFAAMATFQLFNSLNVRSATLSIFSIGFLSNRWLVAAIITGLILQISAIHLPFMQTLFQTTPLSFIEWFLVIIVSSTVLWEEELRKLLAPRLVD